MDWNLPPEALNALLSLLHEAHMGLRALWHALGLSTEVHGQPAWPFAQRLAGERLVQEAGHARRVVLALLSGLTVVLLWGLSWHWRRARAVLWGLTALLLLLTPWPEARLLLAPAVNTSLHQSPSQFTADGIVRGQALYQQHCLRCHGSDGRGEGPDAPHLPMWPPNFSGALLWKRLEGELFWRVRHGLHNRHGQATMPGFASSLNDTQIWELLDFLQAQAAGQTLKESGVWQSPIRLPNASVRCRQGHHSTLRHLTGQRLRIVLTDGTAPTVAEDPRLVTVLVGPSNDALAQADPECHSHSTQMTEALALVLGVPTPEVVGYQLMVDRQGWLRARGKPGQAAWSENDLVCRSNTTAATAPTSASPSSDGLESLIRRMDAEPVRLLRGGFPHGS
ncbi:MULTISPECIES: c-type cytochrome [Giesbergeria]|uniref:C-type cytochrome n=1 Tax=Giesbergeria sinuosa TaxID=80883 RepID=A0ABV9QDW8_9BURK